MAPKPNINQTKAASIVNFFHTSGVAYSVKDLEKALPSAASISSMHVKDYLASLVDEGQIRVEKIGAGNWYWSFPGEARREKEAQVEKANQEKEKMEKTVRELEEKLEEVKRSRMEEDEDGDKDGLMQTAAELEAEVGKLKKEMEAYNEYDVESKKKEVHELKGSAEQWTDQVLEMEKWLSEKMGLDREQLLEMKREIYGEDFFEEEEGLKEL